MTDKPTHEDRLKGILHAKGKANPSTNGGSESDDTEASCEAFGYLRGIRETSASVEFRFRDGNSVWFPYGLLGPWKFNPSEGLLLQFSGDFMYLVLIKGSNLDKPLSDGAINITHAGLQRQRVLCIREMSAEDIRKVGDTGPTIDSIEIGEFANLEERSKWLKTKAPAFYCEPKA